MRFQIFCCIIALSFTPAAAMADAAHYTTLGAKRGALKMPELTIKSLNFADEEAKRKDEAQSAAHSEKTFEDVWAKYEALAEGRPLKTSEGRPLESADTAEKTVEKPVKPKAIHLHKPTPLPDIEPAAANAAVPGPLTPDQEALTALLGERQSVYKEKPLSEPSAKPGGIIGQYEESKARRSQMKSIRLGVPKELEGKTSTKPKPAAEPDVN